MTYCYYCTRHLSILHSELFSSLVLLLSHDGTFYQIYLTGKKNRNPERKALETTEGIINYNNQLKNADSGITCQSEFCCSE